MLGPEILTRADLKAPGTLEYISSVESTVQRYGGESEERVVVRMLAEGGHPLDAFVAQEQSVIYFNRNSEDEKLVAVYPRDGTFWMDHPLVLLDGPWVTTAQQDSFQEFATFVKAEAQQRTVVEWGYRSGREVFSPDDPDSLNLLAIPGVGVLDEIRMLWSVTKKPANLYLVVDVSGSMTGQKLESAQQALCTFVEQIEGRLDKVALIAFPSEVTEVQSLQPLDKESLCSKVRKLTAGGSTELYDAVAFAIDQLQRAADYDRINAIIAMTDGKTQGDFAVLEPTIRRSPIPILLFTVGYGEDADTNVLVRIARLGNGRAYEADPETIDKLYQLLSSFF